MAKLTLGSLIMAMIGIILAIAFLYAGFSYYSSSYYSTPLNNTYQNLTKNYNSSIYAQLYLYSYNSSGGFRSSGALATFSGLAFMFGNFFQIMSVMLSAPGQIFNAFTLLSSWIPLPPLVIAVLALVALSTPVIFLILSGITTWTKVEQE